MKKELFAKDVLTTVEYNTLLTAFVSEELDLLKSYDQTELEMFLGDRLKYFNDMELTREAIRVGEYILKHENVEELLGYDLEHVFSYDEAQFPIIRRIEQAAEKQKDMNRLTEVTLLLDLGAVNVGELVAGIVNRLEEDGHEVKDFKIDL